MKNTNRNQISLSFERCWEYWVNPDGTIRDVSQACNHITGYSSNQFIKNSSLFKDIILLEDRKIWDEHHSIVNKKSGFTDIQLRIKKQNGEVCWIEHICHPIIKQGKILGYHVNNRDITERKKIEDQLLINKKTIDASNDGIIIIDSTRPDYPITYANIAFYSITQYTPKSVMGKTPYFLEGENTSHKFKKLYRAALINEKYFTGEVLHYRKDMTSFWNEITLTPVFSREEKVTHFIIIHKDISKRKQVEQAMHRREEILKAVAFAAERLHRMSDLKLALKDVIKRLGVVTNVSRVYVASIHFDRYSYFSSKENIEWNAKDIQGCLEIDKAKEAHVFGGWFKSWINNLRRNNSIYGSVKIFSKKIQKYLELKKIKSILLIPIFVEKNLWGLIGFDACINEKTWTEIEIKTLKMAANLIGAAIEHRCVEDALRQSHKMEAIGLLAGGIAHDFNNILTAIMGYSDILKNKIPKEDPLNAHVLEIVDSTNKASNLVKGLLAFSRKLPLSTVPLNLNQIVRNSEFLLLRLIDEEIELKTELFESELIVEADTGQIEQILINLIINARDSILNKGKIIIKTELVTLNKTEMNFKTTRGTEQFALLTITDTGAGIDESIIEKIFEPFFTTKEIGKGTGFGLSIVYGIIRQHQGSIRVESRLGKGSTFKVYLPISKNSIYPMETRIVLESPPNNIRETILIAEDDKSVRNLMKNTLENAGYKVISAGDGLDAIRKFKQSNNNIDLLISDAIMPKATGKELYDVAKKLRSDIKALFISGYSGDVIKKKGIDKKSVNFLAKPFIPGTLLNTVRKLLDS